MSVRIDATPETIGKGPGVGFGETVVGAAGVGNTVALEIELDGAIVGGASSTGDSVGTSVMGAGVVGAGVTLTGEGADVALTGEEEGSSVTGGDVGAGS